MMTAERSRVFFWEVDLMDWTLTLRYLSRSGDKLHKLNALWPRSPHCLYAHQSGSMHASQRR